MPGRFKVEGREAQKVKTSGRTSNRGAFSPINTSHGKQSGSAEIEAECFTHIWTQTHGEIVLKSVASPAKVQALLAPYIHKFSQSAPSTPPTHEPSTEVVKSRSLAAELRELKALLDDGILTEGEFTSMKAAVLSKKQNR
jgi:hypothetical protein